MNRAHLIAVARGATPAGILLRNGRVINVFTGEVEDADIAIYDGHIAGVGKGYRGKKEIDLAGAYAAPGFIDAHVHIESSLCWPGEFARGVLPRGVTTAIADPHEIANVAGGAGVDFMIETSRMGPGMPLSVVMMAPSCVPATNMSTAGATLTADDLTALRRRHGGHLHGLAELMNYPGVIGGDDEMLAKISAFQDRVRDGHCPGVGGMNLCAYVAAGVHTDHESISFAEAKEKLSRGMYVLIREASNAKNLDALLPLITPATSRRVCFCTDDRTPLDLLEHGSIDMMVRRAIAAGVSPVDAIRVATINAAECFGLRDRGAVAPGMRADLVVFDDLTSPMPRNVFAGGDHVVRDGKPFFEFGGVPYESVRSRCEVRIEVDALRVPARTNRVRVIGAIEGQLITESRTAELTSRDGVLLADPSRDILKMAVFERHGCGRGRGIGFISGIGLRRGAIAGTVAHDHHNLVVIGADDESMLSAAKAAAKLGGGLSVAEGSNVIAHLALPIAGLMSDRPIEEVAEAYRALQKAAATLGGFGDPFMAMSFMALEVIPSLKLTDKGLVDVERFEIVDLYV